MQLRWEGSSSPPGISWQEALLGERGRSQEECLGLALTSYGRKLEDLPVPTGTPSPSRPLWDLVCPKGQGLHNMKQFHLAHPFPVHLPHHAITPASWKTPF